MSNVWTASASGLWSNAANWSLGRAPKTGDDVEIAPATLLTTTFDLAYVALNSLTLTNAALALQGPLGTHGASLTGASVSGAGTLNLSGSSAIQGLTVSGSVANRGAVTQSNAALTLSGAGAVYNLAGATWTVADASGMTQTGGTGWGFVNYGRFDKTSGSGYAMINANFYSTGVIASKLNGDIVFNAVARLSGTYIGAGMVDYGPNCVATLGTLDVTASTCQTNWHGVVNQVGDMTMHDGSTIMNSDGAKWNFAGDSSIWLAAGDAPGPDINGMGLIAKTKGSGVSHIGVNVAQKGVVSVATGTLSFEGASSAFSNVVNGAGTFQIAAGAATLQAGARLSVARWTLSGGTTTLGANLSYGGAFTGASGAALALGGYTLNLTGAASLSGLAVQGTGVMNLRGTATVSGFAAGAASLRDYGATTQSGGDVTLGAGGLGLYNGSVWTITDGSSIRLSPGAVSTLTLANSATAATLLKKTGAGTSTIDANLVNTSVDIGSNFGGVEVFGGELVLNGTVQGIGSLHIVGASTLTLKKTVGWGQTVFFSQPSEPTSGGTLKLPDLTLFNSRIAGFDSSAANQLLISGGWAFDGAITDATSTALLLSTSHGAVHKYLILLGDYTAGTFESHVVGGALSIGYAPP